jgi:hypothetical protein
MHLYEILDKDMLFEMANLAPAQTNIDSGYIYISTRQAGHGCRIKYFPNLKNQNLLMSVAVPDGTIVLDRLGNTVTNYQRKQVVKFARYFSYELLQFWMHGTSWDDIEVTEFKASLKLPDNESSNVTNIKLVWK